MSAGVQHGREHFRWCSTVARIVAVYEDVLRSKVFHA
jgi:hypothetical protein